MKKQLLVLMLSVFLVLLVACSNSSNSSTGSTNNTANDSTKTSNEAPAESSDKKVKISFFNTSAEVNTVFEELMKEYESVNPNVTVELIPTPVGGAQLEKFQSLLVSKQAATIANIDAGTVLQYKDYFLDLESEKAKYEQYTMPGSVDSALLDGKFLGIPWTAQGYGLLYNKRVVDEVVEGAFDPKSIQTRQDLEALFDKISAKGIAPVIIHGADWSIGAHYLGLMYSLQSKAIEQNIAYINDLQNGSINLAENAAFMGLMDTFDLLAKHNLRKADPLVADINQDSLDFATGKSAFYFMGDWSWAIIGTLEGRDEEYGIIPVPISNNPNDYGNTQVAYSQPKLMAIDKSSSTPEEQQAAKDFLEWMLTSESGQKAIVEKMGLSMPYKDVKAVSPNVMSNALIPYVSEGNTINIGAINYLPQDYWAKTGASMQKYLTNYIDRDGLIAEVSEYWKSTKQ